MLLGVYGIEAKGRGSSRASDSGGVGAVVSHGGSGTSESEAVKTVSPMVGVIFQSISKKWSILDATLIDLNNDGTVEVVRSRVVIVQVGWSSHEELLEVSVSSLDNKFLGKWVTQNLFGSNKDSILLVSFLDRDGDGILYLQVVNTKATHYLELLDFQKEAKSTFEKEDAQSEETPIK